MRRRSRRTGGLSFGTIAALTLLGLVARLAPVPQMETAPQSRCASVKKAIQLSLTISKGIGASGRFALLAQAHINEQTDYLGLMPRYLRAPQAERARAAKQKAEQA